MLILNISGLLSSDNQPVILSTQSQHNAAIFTKNCLLPAGSPLSSSRPWRDPALQPLEAAPGASPRADGLIAAAGGIPSIHPPCHASAHLQPGICASSRIQAGLLRLLPPAPHTQSAQNYPLLTKQAGN